MFNQLKEDINSVFDRDPAARNWFEVLTCYPGLHALLMHRVNHKLWVWGFRWLARWLSLIARWLTAIEIHPGAVIGRRFFIDHGLGVVIGETAEIGNDVTIYQGVTLGGTSWLKGKRHPTLENGVIVGAGAKVLGPFTVHEGARIGSNAVVTKEVAAGATVVGVPGRVIKGAMAPLDLDPDEVQRQKAIAEKMGFDAYGVSEMPDPIAHSIRKMLAHIHEQDTRLNAMSAALCNLDKNFKYLKVNDLKETDFTVVEEADNTSAPCGGLASDADDAVEDRKPSA